MAKRKKIEPLKELPPAPGVNKDVLIPNLNKRLTDARTGNFEIKVTDLSHARRSFCSYEYHLDIKVDITNLNNKSGIGPMVPGMGKDPIQLGPRTLFVNTSYYDFWDMEEQLFDKINMKQLNINEEGYYKKQVNLDTGREEYV